MLILKYFLLLLKKLQTYKCSNIYVCSGDDKVVSATNCYKIAIQINKFQRIDLKC